MRSERHGSKSGRYVGGFLQLFDWNSKSRKKLFSSSKSDSSEHSQQEMRSETNFQTTRICLVDEEEFGSRLSFKGGSDYSCASSVTDEGTKAPGVVARLMGLDSLPTSSNPLEPYSTPFFDTLSLGDAPTVRRRRHVDYYHDRQINAESPPRQALDLRPRNMMPNRPIEKFHTEILPPKSAKTIPVTHNKLLSPIKRPTFVPSQDPAHIMEAAARIINPGPQPSQRSRLSSFSGSTSSVSLKVREMRGKLEGTHEPPKASEPAQSSVKSIRGKPIDGSSSGVKSKGKSISLAIQAKVNVQKREGLAKETEEKDDTKSCHSFNSQSSGPRITNRKQNCSSVLRQNNQKQNCSSKSSNMTSSGKKAIYEETSSQGRQKSGGSRKSSLQARNCENKEVSYSGVKNVPRKRRSIENMQASKNEKSSHTKVEDRNLDWVEESRRKGMDVVSFTFSAPITRSPFADDRSKRLQSSDPSWRLSSPGLVGGDALSVLLEQKLKELTYNFDTPHQNFVKTDTPTESEPEQQFRKCNFQGWEKMENKDNGSKDETKRWNDNCLPSPVSILEPSFLTESFYSESMASSFTEENKQCTSSIHAQEVHASKYQTTETETDTLDSASSTSSQTTQTSKNAWELRYIKDILVNVELMFNDYVTGRTREIVNPHLFHQMEKRRGFSGTSKLERKVLFDCVTECLNLKCQTGGGFETWAKGITTVKRKDRLAEEVLKEIEGWKSQGNSMVDELVDKDMSSKYGKWLDFEVDEFMIGVEIQELLVNSLVEEIVADILPCNLSSI